MPGNLNDERVYNSVSKRKHKEMVQNVWNHALRLGFFSFVSTILGKEWASVLLRHELPEESSLIFIS